MVDVRAAVVAAAAAAATGGLIPSSPSRAARLSSAATRLRTRRPAATLPYYSLPSCCSAPPATASDARSVGQRALPSPYRRLGTMARAAEGEAAVVVDHAVEPGVGGGARVASVRRELANLFEEALRATVPEVEGLTPAVAICKNAKFGDYQCNNAMDVWSRIRGGAAAAPELKNPSAVGQAIKRNLPQSAMVKETSIAGPGFVNVVLETSWVEDRIRRMLVEGVASWAPPPPVRRAVVDFSSPNIAKEMHVGHLRSTIIGDCVSRMLEFCGVDVLRRNHVGDWGTQFGMLIEYLFREFPNWEDIGDQAIGDLQAFYKAAKVKFDEDTEFRARAQRAVVLLQGGDATYRAAWAKICDVSRQEFHQVYQRLGVTLEERGESFYNPYIAETLQELTEGGLIQDSEGARVIFVEGQTIPLMVVKSDGGFLYASTDLAAIRYRLRVERAELVIYITDVGQKQHFDMVFSAVTRAGWLAENGPKARHLGFGLVLGTDGKRLRTRSSEVVRLVDLLDEAKARSAAELETRGKAQEWAPEELEAAAEALGYGAVKYADLKNNRLTNYTFNFEQMLDVRGNTAVYLLYAHARICSILRNSKKDVEELKRTGVLTLGDPTERQLGLHLVQFGEVLEDCLADFLPSTLCDYLYSLANKCTDFYTHCKVVGSREESSRLLLCEATAIVMRQCFSLLGITPLYRL